MDECCYEGDAQEIPRTHLAGGKTRIAPPAKEGMASLFYW